MKTVGFPTHDKLRAVLDASAIIKLVLEERGSAEVRKCVKDLLKGGYALHTVDLALVECLNAVWKHARIHGDLSLEEAEGAAKDLIKIYDALQILLARDIAEEAFSIATGHNVTIYDALYIAAARQLKVPLYTADQKMHEVSKGLATSMLLGF
ncbi:MAG: type II toxin-antitoxin system VapC family toxin [Candidatus Methanomethyliales bacterium]|nr:type II toxin-antitoxin system VapC family toxin [Candidatus Methanomethylicales archaeon]